MQVLNRYDKSLYKIDTSLKYYKFVYCIMCEMLDEIEIEHLRMVLARARKEMQQPLLEEKLQAAVA